MSVRKAISAMLQGHTITTGSAIYRYEGGVFTVLAGGASDFSHSTAWVADLLATRRDLHAPFIQY